MDVKCKHCGVKGPKEKAYCVVINGKNAYFCNEKHHQLFMQEQKRIEKLKADNATIYQLICDVFKYPVKNSALWKERKEWNELKSDDVIIAFLTEKKDYLTSVISKLDSTEYGKIRYLSTIVKNSIMDFKVRQIEEAAPRVSVDETIYEMPQTIVTNNKRRSLADLEDEVDD